jgi:hypothetical protein
MAQLEGAKPSFLARAGAGVTGFFAKFRPGNSVYSLAFGAVGGVILSGLVLAGRTTHVALFDHEYYKVQSRKRYFEKQLLFQKEQEEAAQAHYLAALSAEYNPVATRLPFKEMDAKYRF